MEARENLSKIVEAESLSNGKKEDLTENILRKMYRSLPQHASYNVIEIMQARETLSKIVTG